MDYVILHCLQILEQYKIDLLLIANKTFITVTMNTLLVSYTLTRKVRIPANWDLNDVKIDTDTVYYKGKAQSIPILNNFATNPYDIIDELLQRPDTIVIDNDADKEWDDEDE